MLNSNLNVYRTGWLDLVFENRNQAYGAYELRKNYDRTLGKALFTAVVLFVGLICSPIVYSKYFENLKTDQLPTENPTQDTTVVILRPPVMPAQPTAPQDAAAPASAAPSQPVRTIKLVKPNVTSTPATVEELPAINQLNGAAIGSTNQDGPEGSLNAPAGPFVSGNGSGEGTSAESEAIVPFGVAEEYPEFPGGMQAFAKYLQKNLRYPTQAVETGIVGRVTLSFVVERDGRLTDIKVIKGIGFGCDEEAVRVLKKSPLWTAGMQNNRKVRVQYTMPIVFQMD